LIEQNSDIVVVVDTSGSMAGDKLRFAQEAIVTLIGRLQPGDRLGLVEYSSSARVLATLSEASGPERGRLRDLAYGLHPTGSTNMSAGLDLGIQLLEASRHTGRPGRLLLLSDGLANAGDSSMSGLNARAKRLSGAGFALSTMGIGDDFDEQIMTSLATSGTGAFYYLAHLSYLPEFFEAELNSAKNTHAQTAILRFVPSPGVRVQSAMGLPLQSEQGAVTVRLGSLYASRTRTVWLTLAVPTHSLGQKSLGRLSLSYNRAGEQNQISFGELPQVACLDDEYRYEQQIHRSIWERALLDDVFTQTEEDFGDAIRTGSRAQLSDALAKAEGERKLAERLGSAKVVDEINSLNEKAGKAAVAQSAPAAARNSSAKKSKATGYQKRNKALYDSADRAMEAY
jgi:Ca-activated chloride channel family protein